VAVPREENAGQNHKIQMCNKSFEKVYIFWYLGTIVTYQNYVHEDIMSKFNSGNVCFYSMQNIFWLPIFYPKI
jgi:hypothetical protein